MVRGYCLAALVALVLGSVASAQEGKVTLKHKFPDGRTSTMTAVIKTSQTLNLAVMDLESGSEQSLTVTSTNGERAADGTLIVKSKIDALKAAVTLPGGTEIEFDSANQDADPPGTQFDFLIDVFKATAKSTWEAVMNQDNRVVAIKGRDAAYAELPETMRDAMKAQLDPEYLKMAANDEFDKLQSEPVAIHGNAPTPCDLIPARSWPLPTSTRTKAMSTKAARSW